METRPCIFVAPTAILDQPFFCYRYLALLFLLQGFAKYLPSNQCYQESDLIFPAKIYLFKVNIKNIRKRSEICSKLTIKTPEQRQVNDVFVGFEQVNVFWENQIKVLESKHTFVQSQQ